MAEAEYGGQYHSDPGTPKHGPVRRVSLEESGQYTVVTCLDCGTVWWVGHGSQAKHGWLPLLRCKCVR